MLKAGAGRLLFFGFSYSASSSKPYVSSKKSFMFVYTFLIKFNIKRM